MNFNLPAKGEKRTLIAKTFFGLENVLAEELKDLGFEDVKPLNRAVSFTGDLFDIFNANLRLRTALKVLVNLAKFKVHTPDDLYEKVKALDWEQLLNVRSSFAIDAVVFSKYFNHSKYVSYRVKDAIVDKFREKYGKRPYVDLESPSIQINVHIAEKECTLAIDTTGMPLYKRGYRLHTGLAPLNEVTAAGMLKLAGYRPGYKLHDLFCGSGTILIEAALMATNTAPGLFRTKYAFQMWPGFMSRDFRMIKEKAQAEVVSFDEKIYYAADSDRQSIQNAKMNAAKAGVDHLIDFEVADFKDFSPKVSEGVIISNPPYDERLKSENIELMYEEIGSLLKHKCPGFTVHLISSNVNALKKLGLKPEEKVKLFNGKLECLFNKYDLFEGKRNDFIIQNQ